MKLVCAFSGDVATWVLERVPHINEFRDYAAIGVVNDFGVLIAGAVYHQYHPDVGDIQVAFAADDPRWAQKGTIAGILAFPFRQLGCVRITALTGESNKRTRRFVEGIGFKLEGVVRKGLRTEDMCIYGLLEEEAEKWLRRIPNGKVVTEPAGRA